MMVKFMEFRIFSFMMAIHIHMSYHSLSINNCDQVCETGHMGTNYTLSNNGTFLSTGRIFTLCIISIIKVNLIA